jgi:hypothetical protein
MNFLKSFATWAIFTCLLPLVFLVTSHPVRPFRVADDLPVFLLFFLPFLLIPALGTLVLWLPTFNRDTSGKSMLTGVLLGIFRADLAWACVDENLSWVRKWAMDFSVFLVDGCAERRRWGGGGLAAQSAPAWRTFLRYSVKTSPFSREPARAVGRKPLQIAPGV